MNASKGKGRASKARSSDIAAQAARIASQIKYRWESDAISQLVEGGLLRTASYTWLGYYSRALAGWQTARLQKYGLLRGVLTYDDSIPQSMMDAPIVDDRWEATDLAREVARLLGLTRSV